MAVDRLLGEIKRLNARQRAELFRKLGVEPRGPRKREAERPDRKKPKTFNPIGFGMWEHRPEFTDAAAWVDKLRRQEWNR